jgi:NAD(P)-dependent dehydrogenase (short-subunit alcohol dehydrogenase family)
MAENLFDLTGKVALVTGGTSGLGLGFARGIARAGGDVVVWGRDTAKNARAADDLAQYGGRVLADAVDVADEAQVSAGMARAVEAMGRIDAVFANAGVSRAAPSTIEMTGEAWHDLLGINMHGAFFTLREAARHMIERTAAGGPRGGSLVLCGSLSAYRGVPGMPHYAAAKGALTGLTATMASEFGQYGIRVNLVAPGYIHTGLGVARDDPKRIAQDQAFVAKTPLGRVGYPTDFEGVAVYLASDMSAFQTGSTIVIDGGFMVKM